MSQVTDYIEANRQRFIDDLLELCVIPSVMGEREALERTAALVAEHLRALGADVKLLPTPEGPPVVFGEIGSGRGSG